MQRNEDSDSSISVSKGQGNQRNSTDRQREKHLQEKMGRLAEGCLLIFFPSGQTSCRNHNSLRVWAFDSFQGTAHIQLHSVLQVREAAQLPMQMRKPKLTDTEMSWASAVACGCHPRESYLGEGKEQAGVEEWIVVSAEAQGKIPGSLSGYIINLDSQ